MDTIDTLLDATKEALRKDKYPNIAGALSDYVLAKELDLSRGQISNYRARRSWFSNDVARRIAELTGKRLDYVIAISELERVGAGDARRAWLSIAKVARNIKGAAMFAALAIGAASFGVPLLNAAQCVVTSGSRRRHPRGRSRTKNVTVKSLPAPAATTLPRRDWLGGLR